MVKTFEESQEEKTEERDESIAERGGDEDEYEMVSDIDFDGESIEEFADSLDGITLPTPDELAPGDTAASRREVELRISVLEELSDQLGITLEELQDRLGATPQPDPGTNDVAGLLQILISLIQSQNSVLGVIANTQVSQLQNLVTVAQNISPNTLVTVTGREVISQSGEPQLIIPQSDQTDIPTRELYVRADSQNTSNIAIGDDAVDPDDGFFLKPGEYERIGVDFREQQLYMASEEAGDAVRLLGLF
jgi:hypothetical protein